MVFASQLIKDILLTPSLESGIFALVDINVERLELTHQIAGFLIDPIGRDWHGIASTDRRKIHKDSDYVINTIEVAGLE
ncbi:MAG: hypothetical protein MUO67_24940, partial [Anaerolineales bacterium]|nr:hypothetical protein [Anaerolineales bacterium]